NFILIALFFLFGCGSDDSYDLVLEDSEVLEEQILKENLKEAATIVSQIVREDEVVANEVREMIAMGIYNDDVILFKDLFVPQGNPILKSSNVKATQFEKKFDGVLSQNGNLKSSNNLKEYLIENEISIYEPYPMEDYAVDLRKPTITYHSIDNPYESVGYEPQSDGTY
ncbi:hypothetical protein, partial [Geofilum rubicundum]|uniref:hypothetical protein n=1 Tax=Geofilum rubicundum TaxID=472113 RepID=UPI00138DD6A4